MSQCVCVTECQPVYVCAMQYEYNTLSLRVTHHIVNYRIAFFVYGIPVLVLAHETSQNSPPNGGSVIIRSMVHNPGEYNRIAMYGCLPCFFSSLTSVGV